MAHMRARLARNVFGVLAALALLAVPAAVLAGPETLVYSWTSNVGELNPHLYSPNQMFAQAMVYDPLVRYGEGGAIKPALAEKWEISPDGKTYTFTLRQGVTFSDGTPCDAAAVKKNFDAILANAQKHKWLELVAQIEAAEAPDPRTFRLVLKNPYYPTLQELCLARPLRILAPSAFPDSGNTADGIKKPVGTGPWKLVETKKGEYDLFERNESYWGKKPAIQKILVKVITDPNTRAVAFETGEIDLIYNAGGHGTGQVSLETFAAMQKDGKAKTLVSGPQATRNLAINSDRGPTRDLAVRQAILHAANKAAMVKGIFLDIEKPAETLFSPTTPYCDLGLPPYAFDLDKARTLLDQAGWKPVPGGEFREKDGQELAVDLCFEGNDPMQKAVAETLQGDLRKAGIRLNLIGEEPDSFLARQKSGEFGMIFGDTWGAPYDPHSMVSSMRAPSHADYQAQVGLPMKAALDEKIAAVLVTVDEAKRREMYRDILTTLHEQAVYLPLTYTVGIVAHRDNLDGVHYGAIQSEIPFEDMVKK